MVLGERRLPPPSDTVTAVGVDHVRLSYLYADEGDLEGLESLVHREVQDGSPYPAPPTRRSEVLDVLAPAEGPKGTHHLLRVIADGDCIAAVGRFTSAPATDVEFADIFTIADDGLLAGCRRFYSVTTG
ncbi:ketosteroid isomerase-like protein [Saccharothrix carnea]|uniref:Ketosteroid isomerase-like protein n=1 Tax=Saccharothrix carnea TaxID=1280637 RepID=A0A2P8IF08_SACCR|nr:nuclear transport factor 2 family protein [Saccharothrix carnea]PSL57058.1 ketosteroid isomerase-like protein [Saccharothrix carnea]